MELSELFGGSASVDSPPKIVFYAFDDLQGDHLSDLIFLSFPLFIVDQLFY
jgi:hypothetical protein